MRSVVFSALSLCAVLSACNSTHGDGGSHPTAHLPDPVPVLPVDQGTACNRDVLPSYVGKALTDALQEEIRTRSGARHLRVGKPGMAMTMDFRQDRVTVYVGADNRIESISCG